MFNCSIGILSKLHAQLMLEVVSLDHITRDGNAGSYPAPNEEKNRVRQWLGIAKKVAAEFEWTAVDDRINFFDRKLDRAMSINDLRYELSALKETIEKGLDKQFIYRYSNEKASMLIKLSDDWAPTLKSFPSARREIGAAIDCWALEHSIASVFHAMRVLEHGLRALAKDLGKSFDVQNWQNIIEEIEAEIRNQNKVLPRGSAKSERLRFLSEAAKEFVYFKDGWRNHVSHNRGVYDEHQGWSSLEHVRSFMNGLASELHE